MSLTEKLAKSPTAHAFDEDRRREALSYAVGICVAPLNGRGQSSIATVVSAAKEFEAYLAGQEPPVEYHDEDTLTKVYVGLESAGVTGQQAVDAVNQMQNKGILFRERHA